MGTVSLRLAVLGFGDVGRALADRLADRDELQVTSVTDTGGTLVDADGLDLGQLAAAKAEAGTVAAGPGCSRDWDTREAARQAPADIVVQVTPTDLDAPERGLEEIRAAAQAGRDVVTASKDALACRPQAVREATQGLALRFGAAVGASTPALALLDGGFAGDGLEHVSAVLNGSTTFVLSRMAEGAGFGQALDEAREAGLLEADPSADLDGHDAAAKAAILHQRAYGSTLSRQEVATEGITGIEPAVCRQARRRGMAIRLVARVDEAGAEVGPVQLPASSPLVLEGPSACFRFAFAGAGEITLAGPGAGPQPTAAAVLADVLALPGTEPTAATRTVAGTA